MSSLEGTTFKKKWQVVQTVSIFKLDVFLLSFRSRRQFFKMTFWQENYPFIKDVYLMRQTKMIEWMENVEKAISRIMADKVYTSAEFKRERDNFHVSFYPKGDIQKLCI